MSGELLEDTLAQAVIFALIAVAFFVAVMVNADPGQFYARYYGQDLGLTVEAAHSARGELELAYRSIHPAHAYLFNFTEEELYVGERSKEGVVHWRVRKQYGKDRELGVTPALLEEPYVIDLFKEENISFERAPPGSPCPGATNLLLAVETALKVEAPPEIKESLDAFPLLQELQQNVNRPKHLLLLAITQEGSEATVTYAPGAEAHEAERLACLLAYRLSEGLGRSITPQAATGGEKEGISLSITLPEGIPDPQRESILYTFPGAFDQFLRR